jgi:hypothetical protein
MVHVYGMVGHHFAHRAACSRSGHPMVMSEMAGYRSDRSALEATTREHR